MLHNRRPNKSTEILSKIKPTRSNVRLRGVKSENLNHTPAARGRNNIIILCDLLAMIILHQLIHGGWLHKWQLSDSTSLTPYAYCPSPTWAAEQERIQHDRVIVHCLYVTRTHVQQLLDSMTSSQVIVASQQPSVFLAISMNPTRSIPYINAFVVSYLWSLDKDTHAWNKTIPHLLQNSTVQIHVWNTFTTYNSSNDIFRTIILQLPFLNIHPMNPTCHNDRCRAIQYYQQALQACLDSSLSYCVLLQEATLLPTHFNDILNSWILPEATNNHSSIWNQHLVSLFSMIQTQDDNTANPTSFSPIRLEQGHYSTNVYPYHRALLNSERKHLNLPPYQPLYSIRSSPIHDSFLDMDIALWIPTSLVPKALDFLEHASSSSSHFDNMKSSPFLFEYEYSLYTHTTVRYHIEPSLIQHVGLYPQDPSANDLNWKIDPRFLLDPGLYQHGLDFVCKEDGIWYQYDHAVDCNTLYDYNNSTQVHDNKPRP